ncbi:MAG: ABC transporter ATP-binding protein [Deltaproteobacteria bacterium]|nr:ABC transporter ATP-binding protein [Deltaproteobacteria bacterium]
MTQEYDLILDDVSFSYHKDPVLDDVNIKIDHLDFATVVGPNGSGKSTLLKLLLGVVKPDKGKIEVLGQSPIKSRMHMGYMPQYMSYDSQFPITVCDLVLMGRLGGSLFGKYTKYDKELADSILEEVRLSDFANHPFAELSGGQKQRALLARALCCEPKLLLLDEPTANIDPSIEETLFNLLEKINKRMTIILVSHDLGFVSQVVNSVICINKKVVVHPTSEINGKIIKEIYGTDINIIRHDHQCSEEGHQHD